MIINKKSGYNYIQLQKGMQSLFINSSQGKCAKDVVEENASASEDEEELVAVLTAAAAACMNTSPKKVRINTYKRVHTDPPVWNRAARRETTENKI